MERAQQEFLKEQIIEAAEEYIEEIKQDFFERYPELFSFGWCQSIDDKGNIHSTIDTAQINENEYKGTLSRHQKEYLRNEIFWALETLEPQTLIDLYGNNVKIVIFEDREEIESL